MSKHTVTITIDTDGLTGYTDTYLAQLWYVAQANPVDSFKDREAGRLAEGIGREIIRRFLANTPPELYSHQGHHYDWGQLHLPPERVASESTGSVAAEHLALTDCLEAVAAGDVSKAEASLQLADEARDAREAQA